MNHVFPLWLQRLLGGGQASAHEAVYYGASRSDYGEFRTRPNGWSETVHDLCVGKVARSLADSEQAVVEPAASQADGPGQISRRATASFGMLLHDQLSGRIFRRCDEVNLATAASIFAYGRAEDWEPNALEYFEYLNLDPSYVAVVIDQVQQMPQTVIE